MYLLIPIMTIFYLFPGTRTQLKTTTLDPEYPPRRIVTYNPDHTLRLDRDPLVTSWKEKTHYYPHYGYEPYWDHGQYLVRHPDADLKPGETTTKMPLVCGEECGDIYLRIRTLCASPNYYITWMPPYPNYDYYNMLDYTNRQYVTFRSYCDLLAVNCVNAANDQWVVMYLGPCKNTSTIYREILPAKKVVDRATVWLEESSNRIASAIEFFKSNTRPPKKG